MDRTVLSRSTNSRKRTYFKTEEVAEALPVFSIAMKIVSAAEYFKDLHQRCASTEEAVRTIRRENRVARFVQSYFVISLLVLLPIAIAPGVLLCRIVGVELDSFWGGALVRMERPAL
jgi:hypothetical protein